MTIHKRHKHADLIHAWAEGAEIGYMSSRGNWVTVPYPAWDEDVQYRIKPEPPAWYENIPPQGVLCWVSDSNPLPDNRHQVRAIIGKGDAYFRCKCTTWAYATPLTDDEIRQFLKGDKK